MVNQDDRRDGVVRTGLRMTRRYTRRLRIAGTICALRPGRKVSIDNYIAEAVRQQLIRDLGTIGPIDTSDAARTRMRTLPAEWHGILAEILTSEWRSSIEGVLTAFRCLLK
jgi:hypothetical protein